MAAVVRAAGLVAAPSPASVAGWATSTGSARDGRAKARRFGLQALHLRRPATQPHGPWCRPSMPPTWRPPRLVALPRPLPSRAPEPQCRVPRASATVRSAAVRASAAAEADRSAAADSPARRSTSAWRWRPRPSGRIQTATVADHDRAVASDREPARRQLGLQLQAASASGSQMTRASTPRDGARVVAADRVKEAAAAASADPSRKRVASVCRDQRFRVARLASASETIAVPASRRSR